MRVSSIKNNSEGKFVEFIMIEISRVLLLTKPNDVVNGKYGFYGHLYMQSEDDLTREEDRVIQAA